MTTGFFEFALSTTVNLKFCMFVNMKVHYYNFATLNAHSVGIWYVNAYYDAYRTILSMKSEHWMASWMPFS